MKSESLSKRPVFATSHKMLGVFVPISETFLAGILGYGWLGMY